MKSEPRRREEGGGDRKDSEVTDTFRDTYSALSPRRLTETIDQRAQKFSRLATFGDKRFI